MRASDTSGKAAITHLSHLDDLAIELGAAGICAFIDIASRLSTWNGVRITQKYDGAPALVFGVDPTDEKFFVGTKSAMSSGRLIKKISDVDRMIIPTGPRKQVRALFEQLKGRLKLSPGEAYQMDLMFTEEDKTYEKIDGVGHILFSPNTITYAVTYDDPSFYRVMNSRLGGVVHTAYDLEIEQVECDGEDEEMGWEDDIVWKQSDRGVGAIVESLNNVPEIYARDAYMSEHRVLLGHAADTITRHEKTVKKLYRVIDTLPEFTERMKVFANSQLKDRADMGIFGAALRGEPIDADGLCSELVAAFTTYWKREADKVKTEKVKLSKMEKLDKWVGVVESHRESFRNLFDVYYKMIQMKNTIHRALANTRAGDWKTFIRTPDGTLEPTPGEGFVIITPKNTVKVVDRTTFSAWNNKLPKKFSVNGSKK